ncbi:hypothetical protein D8B26_001289 [Coccidioides posadasii str. Silveira]|uniref:uncharacterized protein n=1 Tax=Coccidioides posadasii (strain RMSCC 757 / Silveira) TaxID=443226 RepID=UPI001BEFBDDB|nr:hypothetical protein D8B26_001289 [Coccidioides posadasii str. Silveira]
MSKGTKGYSSLAIDLQRTSFRIATAHGPTPRSQQQEPSTITAPPPPCLPALPPIRPRKLSSQNSAVKLIARSVCFFLILENNTKKETVFNRSGFLEPTAA